MKNLYCFLLFLLICSQGIAQSSDPHSVFDSYYLKSRTHTANTAYLIRFDVSFRKISEGSFIIKGYFNPKDYYKAEVKLQDSLKKSNRIYYQYVGNGYMAGKEVNFELETSIDLEKVARGYGYEEKDGMSFDDCEINLLYWPKGQSEFHSKENFYIYPKGSVVQED